MSMQVVRIAEPNLRLAMEIRELLAAERLPVPVFTDVDLFAVFDSEGRIEGAAFVDSLEDSCVLGAVVVRRESRKKGLGYTLVSHILCQCSAAHERMFLVSRGAQAYFERFGFRTVSLDGIPERVARSAFVAGCAGEEGPAMVIDLPRGTRTF